MAGTAVLGTRLAIADYHAAAAALLAVAGVCWALLVVPVLRHWKTPTAGISFVLTAATEALAALAAILAVSYRAGWLVTAATATMALGLAFYVFTAARFDLRQLVTGHGDHWLAGGALAIAALAAGHIAQSAATLGQLSQLRHVLTTSTLVLWCLAMVWLLPLVVGEILSSGDSPLLSPVAVNVALTVLALILAARMRRSWGCRPAGIEPATKCLEAIRARAPC